MQHSDTNGLLTLLIRYYFGQTSRKESRYITKCLRENEEARLLWANVTETFNSDEPEYGAGSYYDTAIQQFGKYKSNINKLQVRVGIAALTLLASGIITLYFYFVAVKSQKLPKPKKVVVLIFAKNLSVSTI